MRSKSGNSLKGLVAPSLAICLCFYPVPAKSLPAGGTVTGGNATIAQPNPTTLNINQTSNKAIINWKGFNINVNELVKFSQPSSSAVVLNRVVGGDPSSILGHLVANGRVFLVNSNGIYFGPNSVINAAGLFATTLGIKDSDFLAGKYTFSQDPSKNPSYVINQGQIKVSDDGFVFLVAPGVKNENLIIANLGKVVLASGQQVTVDFMGDGLINFTVEGKVLDKVIGPDGNPLSSAVSNSGTIKADGGQVTLSARASKDIFESVVNNSGFIEAKSMVNRGGVIRLEGSDPVENTGQLGWQSNLGEVQNAEGSLINSGILDVSAMEPGAAQGQVTISGELVGVSGTILAHGANGAHGGRVLITSTTETELTNSSLIDTSGVGNSSAGNVVVWSDKDTIFRGAIVGRGGDLGGDGGQVEVSGYRNLMVAGLVDLSAPKGVTGTLLLDPGTVTICHDTGSVSCSSSGGPNTFSDSFINLVLSGVNLTISTSGASAGAEDIIFQDSTIAIQWTNSNILTFNAGRNISVLGSITAGPGGVVAFRFGQAGAGGTLDFNDATVSAFNFRGGTGADTVNFSLMPSPVSIFFPNSGDVENWIGNGGTLMGDSQPNLFWAVTGPNAGNVNDGVSTFAFTGFSNLTGGTGNDTFAFTGAGNITGNIDGGVGGNNTLNYAALSGPILVNLQTSTASNIGGTFSNINNLVGSADLDTLTGPNLTNMWTINAANAGNVNGVFSFSSIANLVGGSGADNFIFSGGGSIGSIVGGPGFDTADFSALASPVTVTLGGATTELVIGNGGTLVGSNTNNTWTVSGTNAGDFTDGVGTVAFTNFINLTGGNLNDSFILAGGSLSGAIDGGLGNNTLTGGNVANTWNITGGNSGTVTGVGGGFTNIQNLVGGNTNDSFTIVGGGSIGSIVGGPGFDTADFSALASPVTVTLGGATTELVIGNGGTLVGSNTNNTWTVSGTNAGDFTDGVGTVAFTNFINLTGGNLNDSFILAGGSLSGAIDGGLGNNTLTGGNVANTWNITGGNSGTVTGVGGGFINIQNLVGGNTNDSFTFVGGSGVSGNIDGGAGGTNTLNYAALSGPILVNLQTSTASNIGGTFSNINNLVGSGGLDTLTGANSVNTWTVNFAGNSGTVNSVAFSNIENLVGGASTDSLAINGTTVSLTPTQATQGTVTINYSQFESLFTTTTEALTVGGSFEGNLETHSGPLIFDTTRVGGNLSSFATGAVTQTGPLTVMGTALIDAETNSITLANAANNFHGAVTAMGSNISLADVNGITLASLNVSGNLLVTAGGPITDAAGAAINVGGNASFDGTSIGLADANNFGTLTFKSAGAVNIRENSDIVITGTNTANSLILTSTSGSITDAPNTSLTVTNNASFSGTSIVLGDTPPDNNNPGDVTNFGSLTFDSPGVVNITEDSGTVLSGVIKANSLALTSAGSETDDPNTSLTVTNGASFSGTSVDLGNQDGDTMNFGSLTFSSQGGVKISENSDTFLIGENKAESLTLASEVSIDASPGSSIALTDPIVRVFTPLLNPGFFSALPPGAIVINNNVFSNPSVDSVFGLLEKKLVSITTEELALVPPEVLQLDDELKKRLQITDGFTDMRYALAAVILNLRPHAAESPMANTLVRARAFLGPGVASKETEPGSMLDLHSGADLTLSAILTYSEL